MSNFQGSNFKFLISSSHLFSNYSISTSEISKNRYTNLPKFSEFQVLRYENSMFKDAPICFLYLFKYVGDTYGVRGSRFGQMFGRSKNVLTNIAIDQESSISHLDVPHSILISQGPFGSVRLHLIVPCSVWCSRLHWHVPSSIWEPWLHLHVLVSFGYPKLHVKVPGSIWRSQPPFIHSRLTRAPRRHLYIPG